MIVVTAAHTLWGAQVKKLTMAEAVELALKQNRNLKIAHFKVQEAQQEKAGAKSQYLPTLSNETKLLHVTELQNIDIPAGSFGRISGVGPSPPRDLFIDQGKTTLVDSGTSLSEPLTQLIRIHQQNKAADAEQGASRLAAGEPGLYPGAR